MVRDGRRRGLGWTPKGEWPPNATAWGIFCAFVLIALFAVWWRW